MVWLTGFEVIVREILRVEILRVDIKGTGPKKEGEGVSKIGNLERTCFFNTP